MRKCLKTVAVSTIYLAALYVWKVLGIKEVGNVLVFYLWFASIGSAMAGLFPKKRSEAPVSKLVIGFYCWCSLVVACALAAAQLYVLGSAFLIGALLYSARNLRHLEESEGSGNA